MTVLEQIDQMRDLVARSTVSAAEVSGWCVGQQIQHCCLAMRTIVAGVERTEGQPAKENLSVIGRVIFATGRIPRGRAQAPKSVVVDEAPSEEELIESIEKSRTAVQELDPNVKTGYFVHHIFGVLGQARVLRFLEIHNGHHLRIVRDILTAG